MRAGQALVPLAMSVVGLACSSGGGPSGGTPGSIACGASVTCTNGDVCLTHWTDTPGWDYPDVACGPMDTQQTEFLCDDAADCPPDEVCCLHIQAQSMCKTTCDGDSYLLAQLCTTDDECTPPKTCVAYADPSWLRACQ
jgi:hypothetical protein